MIYWRTGDVIIKTQLIQCNGMLFAARIILDTERFTPSVVLFNNLNWLPFTKQSLKKRCALVYKRVHNYIMPSYLNNLLVRNSEIHNRATRHSNINLMCPKCKRKSEEVVLSLLGNLNWLPLTKQSLIKRCALVYKRVHNYIMPSYLNNLLVRNSEIHNRATRHSNINLMCPKCKRKSEGGRTFTIRTIKDWNCINANVRNNGSLAEQKLQCALDCNFVYMNYLLYFIFLTWYIYSN